MRRRKVKGADEKLLSYKDYVVRDNIESLKGNWNQLFKNDNPIHAEFGTGRGKFLTTLAKQNPDINYIALDIPQVLELAIKLKDKGFDIRTDVLTIDEIKEEVLLKAVEKADRDNLKNIVFAWADVSKALDYFDSNELSRVYINFCDPWPKKRWAKRRLTHTNFLNMYREILNPEGEIHFKTDNEGLFEFSLNEIASNNWILKNISLNLANSDFENVTTEYEDKFMSQGLKIFRCEAKSR